MRTWDSELEDVGLGDVGLGDVGLGDVGLGDVGLGDVGLGDVGLGDTRELGDVINKQHLTFALNLQSIIFGGLEKAILCWKAC